MADETTEPQTEGALKKRPTPVNLAIIEAKERGITLEPAKAEKPQKPVKAEKPEAEAEAAPAAEAPTAASSSKSING